jgi:integrase
MGRWIREGNMPPRRGYGTGSVSYEHKKGTDCRDAKQHRNCEGRWRGVASQQVEGKRTWVKVDGPTKAIAAERLRTKLDELRSGVKTSASYTVERAVEDWLEHGLDGKSQATKDNARYLAQPVLEHIGGKSLGKLTAVDVRRALTAVAEDRTTSTMQHTYSILSRAITFAQSHDLVARNVAALVKPPLGKKADRESRAMSVEVALQLIRKCMLELDPDVEQSARSPVTAAYTVLSWSTGIRTEEARALRWSEVDLDDGTVSIIRSARSHGRTKTEGSRRTLELPDIAVSALRLWQQWQQATDGPVFTTQAGGPVRAQHMRDMFKRLCQRAGIGTKWVPRELRHSFVSAMSSQGVPMEEIAWLAGHSTTRTTERVYRRELRPVLRSASKSIGELTAGIE